MYTGSMYGAGINVFAVWNYIITNTHYGVIELNAEHLADTLGGKVEEVESAINFLSKPDPKSRSKAEGGRRIVKEGEYQYRVTNWETYQNLRKSQDLRDYNRNRQAIRRARMKSSRGSRASRTAVKKYENGDEAALD